MKGDRIVQDKMIFYPNEKCLIYAERVVTEIEKILKNPKKIIDNSFLKKYVSVLEEEECTDFLKVCTKEYQLLRKGYPHPIMGTGPIWPIFLLKGRLKKKKQLLYSKCLLSLKSIEEQLKSTTESDRVFLLKVARVLDKAIAEELEYDLRNQ